MTALVIIAIAIVFFYWMLSVGGFLDNKDKQPKKPSRPSPTYSPHTIRDIPKPQTKKQKEIIVRMLNIQDDNEDGTFETKIAGITFHCDETDQGIFKGIIFNENNNPNNPNAMAIASAQSNKIVGYIPNDELKEYSRWCNYKNVSCVGFIKQFTNYEGKNILFGRVVAIKPCNEEFVKRVMAEEIECIEENEEMRYTGN